MFDFGFMGRFEKLQIMDINNESLPEKLHQLSNEEIKAIQDGINQVENGFSISNEEANRRIDEYFKNSGNRK